MRSVWALASGADPRAIERGGWGVACGTDSEGKSERTEQRPLRRFTAKNKTLFPSFVCYFLSAAVLLLFTLRSFSVGGLSAFCFLTRDHLEIAIKLNFWYK